MKGNENELFTKIQNIIKEGTTDLQLPTLTPIKPVKTSIIITDGIVTHGNIKFRLIIKLNKQGYWAFIGGQVRMVKTISQLNEALDFNAYLKDLDNRRNKLIEKLRASGLEEIPGDTQYNVNKEDTVAQFKVNDAKSIQILTWINTHEPLNDRIIRFRPHYKCYRPENFTKEFKRYLND
jgi:hypothetical protein